MAIDPGKLKRESFRSLADKATLHMIMSLHNGGLEISFGEKCTFCAPLPRSKESLPQSPFVNHTHLSLTSTVKYVNCRGNVAGKPDALST